MEKKLIYNSIKELKEGDHLCCLYKTEEERQALITPFIRQGLESREKVIYIVDTHNAKTVLQYLSDDNLDINSYFEKGQLVLLTAEDSYVQNGFFDPDKMIELLRNETDKAIAEGYKALRVTGEMTWALRKLPGTERLIEYEAKLNLFFPESKCLAICQYDMNQFDAELLLNVLRTHPIVVLGTKIYHNFYFIPPDEFLNDLQTSAIVRHRIENLIDMKEIQKKYRDAYNQSEFYKDLLSHDINNILQIILTSAELCSHYSKDGEILEKLDKIIIKIKQQCERGANIVSTIQKISHLEKNLINLQPIEILELLKKEIEFIKESFESKQINIQVDFPSEKLYVNANLILADVFENILYNAVKYNQNSNIEIVIKISKELKGEMKYIKMEFMDNGIGIPDSQKELIFQKRYKLENKVGGMGIGLSLVTIAMNRFNGKVWVEDRVRGDYSKGSNFVILIPETT